MGPARWHRSLAGCPWSRLPLGAVAAGRVRAPLAAGVRTRMVHRPVAAGSCRLGCLVDTRTGRYYQAAPVPAGSDATSKPPAGRRLASRCATVRRTGLAGGAPPCGRLRRSGGLTGRRGCGNCLCNFHSLLGCTMRNGGPRSRRGTSGVFLAHDFGEIDRLDLESLIPGMAAAGALERTATFSQQLRRDLKACRTIGAGNPHPAIRTS